MLTRAVQDAERRLSGGAGCNIHSTAHERPCVSVLSTQLLILEDTRFAYEISECCEAMLIADIKMPFVLLYPSARPGVISAASLFQQQLILGGWEDLWNALVLL